MNLSANLSKNVFEIASGGLKRIGVYRKRSAKNNKWSSILGGANCLLNRETANRLDGYTDSCDYFAQLVQRAREVFPCLRKTATFIIANMVDHEIATEILQSLRSCNSVVCRQIVSHYLYTQVFSRLHDHLDGFRMGAFHHHDVSRPSFRHDFCLKPAAVHGLEVGDNRDPRELRAKGVDTVHPFGNNERGSCF